jgi:hypothetical protein
LPQTLPSLPALLILTPLLQQLDYHLTLYVNLGESATVRTILYLVYVQAMSSTQAKWLKLTFSSSPNPAGKEITMNVFEDEVYGYFGKRLPLLIRPITAVNEGVPTVQQQDLYDLVFNNWIDKRVHVAVKNAKAKGGKFYKNLIHMFPLP